MWYLFATFWGIAKDKVLSSDKYIRRSLASLKLCSGDEIIITE